MAFTNYPYSSVQKVSEKGIWTSHVSTDDFDEAQDVAEIDHLDHPEYAHGVRDNCTQEVIFVLPAEK